MAAGDNELRNRHGRIQHGNCGAKRPMTFLGEMMRAAKRAGHTGKTFNSRARAMRARPSPAAVAWPLLSPRSPRRRVTIIITRIMRPQGQAVASAEGKYVARNYRRRVPLHPVASP